ncbi:DUF3899 domain-containing protein [Bacillus andreraoultii]|uniref:DUF3899 domain-containing protein n=1 Tax=Bacillus andreraoultii TaxID=1499685 RepID=UPI00053A86BA|nr:DUF3899 domain-containing protein [Bacillus andreraoultii]
MANKLNFIILLINLLIIIFLTHSLSLIKLINSFFYIGFMYLVGFLFLFTVKGRFFDGLVYGFRRFNHVMFKRDDYLEEWKDKPLPSENFNAKIYHVFKWQTIILLTVLLLLTVIFYIFD